MNRSLTGLIALAFVAGGISAPFLSEVDASILVTVNSLVTAVALLMSMRFKQQAGKKPGYEFYFRGFAVLSIASMAVLLQWFVPIPSGLEVIRRVTTICLALYGFYLVMVGGRVAVAARRLRR